MGVVTLDQYKYEKMIQGDRVDRIIIEVDNPRDPTISDILGKLIDNDNKAFVEGERFRVDGSYVKEELGLGKSTGKTKLILVVRK